MSVRDTDVEKRGASLAGKRILVGVTGGITAVDTVRLLREMRRHGAEMLVIMTESAQRVITPLAVEWASQCEVITDWDGEIKLFDNTIRTNKKYIDNFGFIIEDPAFYDYLDARKNLQIFCRLTETPFSRINEVLDIVDLLNRQFDKVSNFMYLLKI